MDVAFIVLQYLIVEQAKYLPKTKLYMALISHPSCIKNKMQKFWKFLGYLKICLVRVGRAEKCPQDLAFSIFE